MTNPTPADEALVRKIANMFMWKPEGPTFEEAAQLIAAHVAAINTIWKERFDQLEAKVDGVAAQAPSGPGIAELLYMLDCVAPAPESATPNDHLCLVPAEALYLASKLYAAHKAESLIKAQPIREVLPHELTARELGVITTAKYGDVGAQPVADVRGMVRPKRVQTAINTLQGSAYEKWPQEEQVLIDYVEELEARLPMSGEGETLTGGKNHD